MTSLTSLNKRSPVAAREVVVGVDLGRRTTAIGVFDRDLQPLSFELLPTLNGPPEAVVQSAVIGAREALGKVSQARLTAVGVGVAGDIDSTANVARSRSGLETNAPAGLDNLRDLLEAALGVPSHVEPDVNVGALGAQLAFSPVRHLAYVHIGNDLAVGIVRNGQLERTSDHAVGELCNATLTEVLSTNHAAPCSCTCTCTCTCTTLRNEIVEQVTSFLQMVCLAYDVEVITLGGDAAACERWFVQSLQATMVRREAASTVLSRVGLSARFRVSPVDYLSLLGAARLASEVCPNEQMATITRSPERKHRSRRCR